MTDLETVIPLAVSLALGLLIGVERGWHEREKAEGKRVAGVRTFGLIGLLGGFVGLLADETHLAVIGLGFLSVAAALVAGYVINVRQGGDVGITSLIAGLSTFGFGAAATQGYMAEAAIAAVVTALLLGYKTLLHRWVSALEPVELRAALNLLGISVIILPILPNRGYGPWEALNPFEIWWMVVLISAISFSGYFAMKIMGAEKGAILTSFLAGLASSTALTLHFSRLARSQQASNGALASGVLIACGTMFPRMLVIASIVQWRTLHALLVPAVGMAVVIYAGAALTWWHAERSPGTGDAARLKNPLELRSALIFGGLLAVILLAAKGLAAAFGEAGILILAGISGIADVDAITLTLAKMTGSEITIEHAAFSIIMAGAVNSVVKGVMTFAIGGRSFGVRTAIPLVLAAAVGIGLAYSGVRIFEPG